MKKYIIWAPAYAGSNGIRALYKLYDLLKERGYETFIYNTEENKNQDYLFISEISPEMRQNDIVIYPEIVCGNPLQFQNVVRYVLYYPGENGGTEKYYEGEQIFTWSSAYYADVPVLFLSGIDRKLFCDEKLQKTQNCYFVHKRGKWKEVSELEGCVEINMSYPETRTELAQLLKTTDILYSYDDCSALLEEARLCGAKVKIIEEIGFKDYTTEEPFDSEELNHQLTEFIDITQSMNVEDKPEDFYLPVYEAKMLKKYKKYKLLYFFTRLSKFAKRMQALKLHLQQYGYQV